MRISREAAIAASGARVLGESALPATFGCSTDTRTLAAGDAFVALRGERFDGHRFVAAALERGAAVLVVDDPSVVPPGVPALVVRDTRAAYLAFGAAARAAADVRVVAITGSAGKTTTKTFVHQLLVELCGAGAVASTPLNENNEIGVAKLLLGLEPRARFMVVEMGARHPGEIEPLARAARPEVAVLTNVGEAHLEIFGSREALATTKWGIFATGARPVLNALDPESRRRAPSLSGAPLWFAASAEIELDDAAARVLLLRTAESDVLLALGPGDDPRSPSRFSATAPSIAGEHNRENVVAAAAAVIALGFPAAAVAASLSALRLPAGRYERLEVDGCDLIYDAYNASMSGTLATLSSFAREPAARRIAVLGGMAELGADAAEMHRAIGAAAARANVDRLLVGGEFASEVARGALEAGYDASCIVRYGDNEEALAWLREHRRPGDLVLLKASRRYRLEEIVEGLRAVHGV